MRFHRVLLIVNPVARTYSRPILAVIEKALSADFRLEVAETKGRGHARELAGAGCGRGRPHGGRAFRGRDDQRDRQRARGDRDGARAAARRRDQHPGPGARPAARSRRGDGHADLEGARRRCLQAQPRPSGRPLLRRQLRRRRGRGGDEAPRREVPQDEGEVRPGRVPGRRVAAPGRVRGPSSGSAALGRRRRADPVALGDGRADRSVHVLQGRRPPDDAGRVPRRGARRAVGAEARAPEHPEDRLAGLRLGAPRARSGHRLHPRRLERRGDVGHRRSRPRSTATCTGSTSGWR